MLKLLFIEPWSMINHDNSEYLYILTVRTIATSYFCIWNYLDNLINSHAKMSVWSRVESGSYLLTRLTHQPLQLSLSHTYDTVLLCLLQCIHNKFLK